MYYFVFKKGLYYYAKNANDFLDALGQRESSGNYKAKNKFGYIGKYQMGEAAMIDAGYYKKSSKNYNNDWSGEFTGKDGVYSVSDFLNNPVAQENAQKIYKKLQWKTLKNYGADKYVGQVINGIEITPSGLLAGAHLKGYDGVMNYLKSNGQSIGKDGFGTDVESYIKKFSGYDISDITDFNNSTSPAQNPLKTEPKSQQEPPPMFYGNIETDNKQEKLKEYGMYPHDPNRVYTFEELPKMKPAEFLKNQARILSDFTTGKIMREAEAKAKVQSGELIYVQSYQRSDGTDVKGYYRRR